MIGRLIAPALVLLLAVAGCASGPQVGSAAPQFSAEDAEGNTVSLGASRGTVLILDFWAVW